MHNIDHCLLFPILQKLIKNLIKIEDVVPILITFDRNLLPDALLRPDHPQFDLIYEIDIFVLSQ